jgi:polyisoprenoid-binding protein YceI
VACLQHEGRAEVAKWTVDPDHSVAAFSILHMMIAHVRGQFNDIEGVIYFDRQNIEGSSAELTIKASSVATGIQKRDDHLRSPDFFDVDTYPDISFKSTRIDSVEGNQARVFGNLTLHGVTREIMFAAAFSGPAKDPFGDGLSMGFTASTVINREDYGMKWNQPMEGNGLMLGRDVELVIDLEADLASE